MTVAMLMVNTVAAAEAQALRPVSDADRRPPGRAPRQRQRSPSRVRSCRRAAPRASRSREHARGLVGYVDAANLTDNPTATRAHVAAGRRPASWRRRGSSPPCSSRRATATGSPSPRDLLGAWALGARNVFCLTGDPLHVGDHPDATVVGDLTVNDVVALARRLRDDGTTLAGAEVADPPRYLIGVADVPLADPYDPARLESKLDAGADFVWTQIVFDVDALRGVGRRRCAPWGCSNARRCSSGSSRSAAPSRRGSWTRSSPASAVPADPSPTRSRRPATTREASASSSTVDVVARIRTIPGVAGHAPDGDGPRRDTRDLVARAALPRPRSEASLRRRRPGAPPTRVVRSERRCAPRGPTYSRPGRMMRLFAYCSRTCAVHPAIRASAKIGRHQVGRDPEQVVHAGRVEVDVRVQPLLLERGALERREDLVPAAAARGARPCSCRAPSGRVARGSIVR